GTKSLTTEGAEVRKGCSVMPFFCLPLRPAAVECPNLRYLTAGFINTHIFACSQPPEVGYVRAGGVKIPPNQNNKQRRLRMPNEDNTQPLSNSNSQVIAAIRALEDRVMNVEGIIVARLNDTRPLERQILARIDELGASVDELAATVNELRIGQNELRIGQNEALEKIATIQEDQAAMRADYDRFRQETDQNFRMMIKRQDLLNNDNLGIRAEHTLLEERVTRLEQEPIESAT